MNKQVLPGWGLVGSGGEPGVGTKLEKCDSLVLAPIPRCLARTKPEALDPQADGTQQWQVLFSTLGWTQIIT